MGALPLRPRGCLQAGEIDDRGHPLLARLLVGATTAGGRRQRAAGRRTSPVTAWPKTFGAAVGLPSTADPSVRPEPRGDRAPDLRHSRRIGVHASFEQKFSARCSRAGAADDRLDPRPDLRPSSGWLWASSSWSLPVLSSPRYAERKREFGIMSSIGLADEVLYFFLVESAIVFVAAYVAGVLGAGVAVALVIPGIATPTAWAQAAGMVAAFLLCHGHRRRAGACAPASAATSGRSSGGKVTNARVGTDGRGSERVWPTAGWRHFGVSAKWSCPW